MTEHYTDEPPAERLPQAVVQPRSRLSVVWIIPLVAAVIGAWLAYKAYSEEGPTITITFKTAEGLEAGKTKLKYKDVEVGQVESIVLAEGLSNVVVTAKLVKSAEKYLTEGTRFWVVRARIAAGQVTGLSTLFAGAYIGVDLSSAGERTTAFIGLETPPVVTANEPGRHFVLQADELGSLEVGSPLYFREIKVGEVVAYDLQENGQSVDIRVFVRAPHHERVHEHTSFWNASGLDVSLGASGLEVKTQSLVSLLLGGIAFENAKSAALGPLAEEDTVFRLYPDRKQALEEAATFKSQWLLHFTGSVRGLSVGAPVEFRGIKLGEVISVKMELDLDTAAVRIPVLIETEPRQIKIIGDMPSLDDEQAFDRARREMWNRLVAKGLRAQLKTGSLLTGALFVELDFSPNAAPRQIVWDGETPELPTVPTPLEELKNVLAKVSETLERLPLEQMSEDLQKSLGSLSRAIVQIEQLASHLNSSVVPELGGALTQARKTLVTAEKTLNTADKAISPNSALQQEAQSLLRELGAAARSIRVLASYLERHPEALIKGKGGSRP
jgi:paraquat-inducible protein B